MDLLFVWLTDLYFETVMFIRLDFDYGDIQSYIMVTLNILFGAE